MRRWLQITSCAAEFLGCFILFDYRNVDSQLVFLLLFCHFSHKHRELLFYFAVFEAILYINYSCFSNFTNFIHSNRQKEVINFLPVPKLCKRV